MAQITAAMVKDLRETTGAGMMDCKKALMETDGDKQKAIDYLREKGIAKAAKKADRVAAEGAVGAFVDEAAKVGALVEVNCETDFVAKTEQFHAIVDKVAKHIAAENPVDMEALNASTLEGKSVAEFIQESIAAIGEKIDIRRFTRYETAGRLTSYIHMKGKIGVLVDLSGGTAELGKDIAMQVAASNPVCVERAQVDPAALEHEREVLRKQTMEEGKPENIVETIVEGRRGVDDKEGCLGVQPGIKEPKMAVAKVLGDVKPLRFVRYQLGEGIEKKQEDCAAEVMAQVK